MLDVGKWNSQIHGVSEDHNLACIDNVIAYFTNMYVCFYNISTENIITDTLPNDCNVLEVSAGEGYFYFFLQYSGAYLQSSEAYYMRIYNQDGSLFKEVSVPFQRMLVSDGMVYAYWDRDYEFKAFDCRIGNIEATHYLSEKEFLTDFANKVSDWNEISGNDILQIGARTFYRYPADGYSHKNAFYCDDKQLNEIQQFYFTEYIDGELATPPEREMDMDALEQLYTMMKKEEKNFVTFASEVNGIMYGVCNVYKSQPGFLTQMDTSCVDYSISFFYNENTDSLEKIDEYEDVELIYTDGKHVIIHKVDGVYYINPDTNQEGKILDYDGAIGITVLDGLLAVQKNESYTGIGDEKEFYWGKDTVFVKKLW